jgi:hypothetical protein
LNLKFLAIAMALIAAILGFIGLDRLGYGRLAKSQLVFGAPIKALDLLRAASRDGPLLVRTLGGAYGLSGEALNARVVEKLRGGIAEPWLQLETDPGKTRNGFALAFAFDATPESARTFAELCAGTVPARNSQSDEINVYAVLCGPNGPVVAMRGWTKRPETVDDAALGRTILQTGLSALRGDT